MKTGYKKIILITSLALVGPISILNAQWTQAGLSGKSVYSFASDGQNLFTGAFASGVFLSADNGSNWAAVNSGLPAEITTFNCYISSFAISDTTIFSGTAGTSGAGVFVSSNNGTNWSAVNNGLTNLKIISLAISGTNIFAGTNGGGVFLSSDNGANWTAVNTGLTISNSVSSLATSSTGIFAGTSGGGVFLSTDSGSNWTAVNTGLTNLNVQSLATSGTGIFAGTNGGGIFLTTDSGSTWTAVNTGMPVNASIYSLGVSGSNIFAGIKNNGVFLSKDNGTNWTAVNTGLPNLNFTSFVITGTYIFAGIDLGGVWKRPLSEMITGIEENSDNEPFTVCPNPFTTETNLQTGKILKDATLIVYNSNGQQVRQIKNISGQTISLSRDNLPGGLYFLQLTEANKVFATYTLIITDD